MLDVRMYAARGQSSRGEGRKGGGGENGGAMPESEQGVILGAC